MALGMCNRAPPGFELTSSDSANNGADLFQAAMALSRPSTSRQLVHTQQTCDVDGYMCVPCNEVYLSWVSFNTHHLHHHQCGKAGGVNPDGLRGEALAELRREAAVCYVEAADGRPSRDVERPTIPRFTMPLTELDREAFRRQKKVPNTHVGRRAPVTCCTVSQGPL